MSNESLRGKIVLKNKQTPWMRSIRILKNDYKLILSTNNTKGFVEGQER